jgi:threonine/homoserine/homoserine lactone efflux protein
MTLAQLLAFNVALIVAMFTPGPAFLVAAQTNLRTGRRAGIAVGSGLGLMAATWTLLALAGFAAVFELFPAAYAGARIVGALYLLTIAIRMWRGATHQADPLPEPAHRAFRQGLFINLFNPKSVLFSAAVLVAIFPGGLGAANSVLIAVNHLLIELSFYTALAVCLNTEAVAGRYLRAKIWIDRGAAAILGALGVRILLSR